MRFIAILLCVLFLVPEMSPADTSVGDLNTQKQMQIASLKKEITELETELAECARKNKNWKTATYVGAAGTAITGIAAIAQGVKLNKLKKENAGDKSGNKTSGNEK